MATATIDSIAALVVIDMQNGVVGMPTAHPMPEIIANVVKLTQAFRKAKLPVVLVNVEGLAPGRTDQQRVFNPPEGWQNLIPELERQPSDFTVTKYQIGAFYGTALERILRREHVTQIVLVGVATSAGVEATAREAYDRGYTVTIAADAMTDRDEAAHTHSIEKSFPRIAEVRSVDAIAAALSERAA